MIDHTPVTSRTGHGSLTVSIAMLAVAAVAGVVAARQPAAPSPPTPASAASTTPPASTGAGPSAIAPTDPAPPTGVQQELSEIRPGLAIKRAFDEIAQQHNLRLALANTLLFQQASGGPGRRSAGSGDVDVLAKWTAVGAGTKDTGVLAFAAEYRYQIGDQPPSALGGEIGTLLPTTNGFSERPWVVKEIYWDQRLFEDRFRYAVGRIDPESLFGGHRLQSANLFFLNKAFSSNPAVAYPGPGAAIAAQIKPVPWFYCTVGLTDANGSATTSNIEGFFNDSEFLTFVEAALTPTIDGLGPGRYRLAFWHIDERKNAGRPSDEGVSISCDQDFSERFTAFARYGYSGGDVAVARNSAQAGLAVKDFGGDGHLLGVAAAWSSPRASGKRDENVVELFQRFQVTETAQLTVGAQAIFHPSNAPDDDVLAVFSARLRVAF